MQVTDDKNKFTVKEFFKSVNIKQVVEISGLKHGLKFLDPTTLDFEKSYAFISFKIFNAVSWEKK